MKKFVHLTFIVFFAFILSSCARATPQPVDEATPLPADERINPGDKICDFLITTGDGEDIIFVTKLHCPFNESTQTESCEQPVGAKVNISQGIFADPSIGKTLDELWSEQTYEMAIEGRPVNLQAFGSVDFYNTMVGTVRVWDVVIVIDKPGKITAHSKGVVAGDPWNYTAIITFTEP
ncbi:MAG: hypothetical protein HY865_24785 [Chloroflexi bacterium]|nr:hypothetical protein [Chloroflexota bacterium]